MEASFQFRCSCGKNLEVEVKHAEQHVICPFCGKTVLVPRPTASELEEQSKRTKQSAEVELPKIVTDDLRDSPAGRGPVDVQGSKIVLEKSHETYHISCPKGFVMDVPKEMLGQVALCPCCHQRVALRLTDTHEHRSVRAIEEAASDEKLGRFWLKSSIIIAAVIFAAFLLMLFVNSLM